jgi:hypothetical protein
MFPGKPTRSCDKCTAEMTHLANLPAFRGGDPTRVFRCYVCNNVVSEKNQAHAESIVAW